MVFGPRDGYLYIGSGNGGSPWSNDHDNRGQDPNTLLGKILRIDVESDVRPYAIPADNPFVQVEGYRDEIWALGLRNPWGLAFDSETGDLYLPDVGNTAREEVNFQPAASDGGENYGWRIMEGTRCVDFLPQPCSPVGMTGPVVEYDHLQWMRCSWRCCLSWRQVFWAAGRLHLCGFLSRASLEIGASCREGSGRVAKQNTTERFLADQQRRRGRRGQCVCYRLSGRRRRHG